MEVGTKSGRRESCYVALALAATVREEGKPLEVTYSHCDEFTQEVCTMDFGEYSNRALGIMNQ